MSELKNSRSRGDFYAHLHIETPKNLNQEQIELIKDLHTKITKGTEQSEESIFSKMKNLWK